MRKHRFVPKRHSCRRGRLRSRGKVMAIVDVPNKKLRLTEMGEIAEYLGTGSKPDGDVAGGLMGEVIEGTLAGYKDLTKADRLAIAQYLKTIPAVSNKIVKSGK